MAENALVDRDIQVGEQIVRALDAFPDASMHPTAALWFYFPDEETWRLLLALPAMTTQQPQDVYTRLLDVIRSSGTVTFFNFDSVGLLPPQNPITDLMGVAIQTPPDAVAGIRFSNSTVNGQLIPDTYIYRLTQQLPGNAPANN